MNIKNVFERAYKKFYDFRLSFKQPSLDPSSYFVDMYCYVE